MTGFSDLNVSVERVAIATEMKMKDSSRPRKCAVERVGKFLMVTGWLGKGSFKMSRRIPVVGVLDIPKLEWRWIEYHNSLIHEPHMFLYDDSLYLYNEVDFNGDRTGKVSRFDLNLEEWSYCNVKGQSPGARPGCTGNYLEKLKRFVVFGGVTRGGPNNDVHLFLMPERRWMKPEVKGKPPQGRYCHSSCVHYGTVFFLGGRTRNSAYCTDGLFMLRIGHGGCANWSSIQANGPENLVLHSAAMISSRGQLWICGGVSEDPHGLVVYDLQGEEFKQIRVAPTALEKFGYGGAAFMIEEGRTFGIFGGQNKTHNFVRLTVAQTRSAKF